LPQDLPPSFSRHLCDPFHVLFFDETIINFFPLAGKAVVFRAFFFSVDWREWSLMTRAV